MIPSEKMQSKIQEFYYEIALVIGDHMANQTNRL